MPKSAHNNSNYIILSSSSKEAIKFSRKNAQTISHKSTEITAEITSETKSCLERSSNSTSSNRKRLVDLQLAKKNELLQLKQEEDEQEEEEEEGQFCEIQTKLTEEDAEQIRLLELRLKRRQRSAAIRDKTRFVGLPKLKAKYLSNIYTTLPPPLLPVTPLSSNVLPTPTPSVVTSTPSLSIIEVTPKSSSRIKPSLSLNSPDITPQNNNTIINSQIILIQFSNDDNEYRLYTKNGREFELSIDWTDSTPTPIWIQFSINSDIVQTFSKDGIMQTIPPPLIPYPIRIHHKTNDNDDDNINFDPSEEIMVCCDPFSSSIPPPPPSLPIKEEVASEEEIQKRIELQEIIYGEVPSWKPQIGRPRKVIQTLKWPKSIKSIKRITIKKIKNSSQQ